MSSGIVIVGAGECGARAAFALREQGYSRPVTLIGAEPHAPYERPPLSKSSADGGPTYVAAEDRYSAEDIALLTSVTVERIDRENRCVHLSSDSTLAYDKLLLTTGATPRMLPGVSPGRRIRAMRTFDDARAIRSFLGPGRRILVIGGGFIGLELAAAARAAGTDVIVLETQARVLSRGVPEEIASTLVERHIAEGVRFECGIRIQSIEETDESVEIALSDGRTLVADAAVVGIGVVPNTQLAEAAGLLVDNGIAVNERLETSAADIYAAGDCCSSPAAHYGGRRVRLEAWRNAQDQGTLAARMLIGRDEATANVPWMWSDQYDLTLQVAGLADGATATVRRELEGGGRILFHLDAEGRLLAASGIGLGNSLARDMRLAEMLIAAMARPDPALLADRDHKLKAMLPR